MEKVRLADFVALPHLSMYTLLVEAWFLTERFVLGVYYFISVEDLAKAREKFESSELPIDKEYAEMTKRCFDPDASKQLENTYVFSNSQIQDSN